MAKAIKKNAERFRVIETYCAGFLAMGTIFDTKEEAIEYVAQYKQTCDFRGWILVTRQELVKKWKTWRYVKFWVDCEEVYFWEYLD